MVKKISFWIILILLVLIPAETLSRYCLTRVFKVSFRRPGDIIYTYYRELGKLRHYDHKDATYDILMLGASTLNPHLGDIEPLLLNSLSRATKKEIRIFNLAQPAHSSRDSRIKYEFLKSKKFDLVIVYDNINEVRANNCPPNIFRDDYSHYSWYEDVNIFWAHPEIRYITLPYVLHKIYTKLYRMALRIPYVPTVTLDGEWLRYGDDIKTKASFAANIRAILDLASKKRERVLLMTFAYYVPQGYTRAAFDRKELDYGYLKFSAPVEEWGLLPNVIQGLEVHNQVIRDLARDYPQAYFIDQVSLMPKNGEYFADICHFTPKGCRKFVENLSPVVLKNLLQLDVATPFAGIFL